MRVRQTNKLDRDIENEKQSDLVRSRDEYIPACIVARRQQASLQCDSRVDLFDVGDKERAHERDVTARGAQRLPAQLRSHGRPLLAVPVNAMLAPVHYKRKAQFSFRQDEAREFSCNNL